MVDDIVQQLLHRDEHAGVVGCGREDEVAVLERVGDDVARGRDGGVVHLDLDAAVGELGGEDVRRVLGVAVDAGVGYQDALDLGGVAGPLHVLLQEIAEAGAPDKAVQRADVVDFKPCGLAQHGLHLRAVLAHDIGVIAPGLVEVLVHEVALVGEDAAVERAEGAEGIRGKEDLVRGVIGHHDLRPVHHGRHDKGEDVPAGAEGVALLDEVHAPGEVGGEEAAEHVAYLRVAHDGHVGIAQGDVLDGGRMVRLHVGDDQVVELAAAEGVVHVVEEVVRHGLVHRVEQDGLFVEYEIGVVGYAVGHAVDALEQSQTPVVGTDPYHVVGDSLCAVHNGFTSLKICGSFYAHIISL